MSQHCYSPRRESKQMSAYSSRIDPSHVCNPSLEGNPSLVCCSPPLLFCPMYWAPRQHGRFEGYLRLARKPSFASIPQMFP